MAGIVRWISSWEIRDSSDDRLCGRLHHSCWIFIDLNCSLRSFFLSLCFFHNSQACVVDKWLLVPFSFFLTCFSPNKSFGVCSYLGVYFLESWTNISNDDCFHYILNIYIQYHKCVSRNWNRENSNTKFLYEM